MSYRAKSRTVAEWNQQWGRLGREGNLWWLGSKRANWEMVMGEEKLGWFRKLLSLLFPLLRRADPPLPSARSTDPSFADSGRWTLLQTESALLEGRLLDGTKGLACRVAVMMVDLVICCNTRAWTLRKPLANAELSHLGGRRARQHGQHGAGDRKRS